MATRRHVDGGRERPAPASKTCDGLEQSDSRDVLVVAGVEICKEGENLSEEELDRRFALAEEAMWKKLHDDGYLPLTNDTGEGAGFWAEQGGDRRERGGGSCGARGRARARRR